MFRPNVPHRSIPSRHCGMNRVSDQSVALNSAALSFPSLLASSPAKCAFHNPSLKPWNAISPFLSNRISGRFPLMNAGRLPDIIWRIANERNSLFVTRPVRSLSISSNMTFVARSNSARVTLPSRSRSSSANDKGSWACAGSEKNNATTKTARRDFMSEPFRGEPRPITSNLRADGVER
jgi:hypothetical protein